MSMAWFRWHHGSVNDPKFALIAKRSETNLAAVMGVWIFMLEAASQSDDRGHIGEIDFESVDLMLGLDDGLSKTIHDQMISRNLLTDDGHIASWEKRQPKRERDDAAPSTERVRKHRAKVKVETNTNDEDGVTDDAKPSNASNSQETPREEESRGEESIPTTPSSRAKQPGKFLIFDGWLPSDYFPSQILARGLPESAFDKPRLAEFISYWSTRDKPPRRTQQQWEHTLLSDLERKHQKFGANHANNQKAHRKLTSIEAVEQAAADAIAAAAGQQSEFDDDYGQAIDVEDYARVE